MPDIDAPASGHCIAATGARRTRFGARPAYAEGLYALEAGCYGWLVPNGSWGEANAGLVVGKDAALLIDTLWDLPCTEQMLEAMRETLSHPPITTLVNTHADGDHYFGNALLADADIITSAASLVEMAHKTPAQMRAFLRLGRLLQRLPARGPRRAGAWFCAMGAPYDFTAIPHTPARRSFHGRMTLDIGGRTVQLIEVGPAHTQGDLVVHIPDAGLVYAGDVAFVGSTPVMWAGPVANWRRALDTIAALEPRHIVPGHGPVITLAGLEPIRAYWDFIEEAVTQRYQAGMSPRRAAHEIARSRTFQSTPFARWIAPERLMTNSYMICRHLRGKHGHPSPPTLLKILYDQAQLAAECFA